MVRQSDAAGCHSCTPSLSSSPSSGERSNLIEDAAPFSISKVQGSKASYARELSRELLDPADHLCIAFRDT